MTRIAESVMKNFAALFQTNRARRARPTQSRWASGPAEILEVRKLPTIITVDTNLDVVQADNRTSMREAITFANNNLGADTIVIAPELAGRVFQMSLDRGFGAFQITDDLTLNGVPDNLNTRADERVTFDGRGLDFLVGTPFFAVNDGNVSRDINVVISDLNLAHGSTRGTPGGAITNQENLTLNRVNFTGNASVVDLTFLRSGSIDPVGGAIANYGILNVAGCTFTANTAPKAGGAIYNAGLLNISNSSFYYNGTTADGGAIYNGATGVATIRHTVIAGNTAGETGAGIDNRGSMRLENSQVNANRLNSAIGGAGIYNDYGANAVIRDSEITRNLLVPIRSGIGGAGILTYGNLEVGSSVIAGNCVTVPSEDGLLKGGGINVQAGFVTVTNILFDSNFARQGGAIHVENGTARVESSRFIRNSSENRFGGNNFFSPDTREGAGSAWSTSNGGLTLVAPYFENNFVTAAGGDFGNSRVSRVANQQPQGYVTIIPATPTSGTTTPSGSQVATGTNSLPRTTVNSLPRTSVDTTVGGRVNTAANRTTSAGFTGTDATNSGRRLR